MKAVIVGAGGHGRVILDMTQGLQLEVVGFLDDNPALYGRKIDGTPVLGGSSLLGTLAAEGLGVLLGIGDNAVRARFYGAVKEARMRVLSAVHPRAVVSKRTEIGEGVIVMAGAVINVGSKLGNNVCINTGATVDHDNVLEDHVHVYPGAHLTGGVTVKKFSYVSSGAVVGPNVTVGENVTVTAGAVVLDDVPDHVIVGGVPAKILKYKDSTVLGRLR